MSEQQEDEARRVMIGYTRIIAVIFVISLFASACSKPQQIRHGYTWVPIRAVVGHPSDEQKEILSELGFPHAVWQKPFGIFEWVYCLRGSPTRTFDFDVHGGLLGKGAGGRKDLCVSPAREHLDEKGNKDRN